MSDSIFDRKPYTAVHKRAFDLIRSLSAVANDSEHIMIRKNIKHENVEASPIYPNPDDLDTFVITTSADSENMISLESIKNTVNLNVRDGGFF